MSAASYLSPVNQLLSSGDCRDSDLHEWPNYLELGITNEHIPELVRMARASLTPCSLHQILKKCNAPEGLKNEGRRQRTRQDIKPI